MNSVVRRYIRMPCTCLFGWEKENRYAAIQQPALKRVPPDDFIHPPRNMEEVVVV